MPEQVKNEFYRRREEELSGYYNQIEMYKPSNLPNIPDFEDERRKLADFKNEVNSLLADIKNKFEIKNKNKSFLADNLIKNLFSSAKFMPYDESVIKKAFRRIDLGNPPGKKDSYGDSIIWETLLKDFPEGEDLHFVGSDPHFKSKINKNTFSPFLLKEWSEEKKSKIVLYSHLGDFTKAKIPEIESSDKIIEQETKKDNEYLSTFGSIMSRVVEDWKLGNAMTVLAQETKGAAMSRIFEDWKLGDAMKILAQETKGVGISALNGVEKEKETFMTPRDTEEHENNN